MFKSMQEAYDKAVDHLEKQGRRALYRDSEENLGYMKSCVYLASNGDKCVVGAFIPEGHPGQEYEEGVIPLLEEFSDLKAIFKIEELYLRGRSSIGFWNSLQEIHDAASSLSEINNSLASFASRLGLTPRKLTKWEAFP